jgi:hypothetical protein
VSDKSGKIFKILCGAVKTGTNVPTFWGLFNLMYLAKECQTSVTEQNSISVRHTSLISAIYSCPADGGLRMHRNFHKLLPDLVVILSLL